MKKIVVLKTDGNVAGYDTIQAGVTAGASGDCVVIYPGTYAETVTLKNGVNLFCMPGVIITGVIDNGVTCVCKIKGSPTITTTTLTGSGSAITGDSSGLPYKIFKAFFSVDGDTGEIYADPIINTFDGSFTWAKSGSGTGTLYNGTYDGSDINPETLVNFRTPIYGGTAGGVITGSFGVTSFESGVLCCQSRNTSGVVSDTLLTSGVASLEIIQPL